MIRKIIPIDEEKCNGWGACATACHEGAIQMVGGVAKLTREDFCDGLGDCLPACPTGAIRFEMREAPAYDAKGVENAKKAKGGCPGSRAMLFAKKTAPETSSSAAVSRLSQWPCQLRLVPVGAPYFDMADLLIAADCTAFAYGNFHEEFIRNHITLIACPKLDSADYIEKLTEIFRQHPIKSITVARMEVPCCGGLEQMVRRAIEQSGKEIPLQITVISTDGKILSEYH